MNSGQSSVLGSDSVSMSMIESGLELGEEEEAEEDVRRMKIYFERNI